MSKDSAAVSLYETSNGQTLHYDVIDGTGHSEALKITSKAQDITVYAKRLIGGREDCLDINDECRNIRVCCDSWEPAGEYLATLKGGSSGITLEGTIARKAQTVEIDCGNWSDQSNDPTSAVTCLLTLAGGGAWRYRLLNYDGEFHGTAPKTCTLRLPPLITKLWLFCMGILKALHII